jgi:hypothetical protein
MKKTRLFYFRKNQAGSTVFKTLSIVGVNTESSAVTESSPVSPGQGNVKNTLDCGVAD